MLTVFALYALVGAVGGVLAGLLGIGGGLVIVPMLVFAFPLQGIGQENLMHLALGTSMASIIFTSISSFMAHNRRGSVLWPVFKSITPGILAGAFAGTYAASAMSTSSLKGFFAIFLYYVAAQMLRGKKPKPSRQVPGALGMFGAGSGIGIFSSLVGIGGGTLSVPFLVWSNVTVHKAIGTAAAIGLPIALAGTAGYVINGWNAAGTPDYSLGFVYLPALFGIVCASVLTAPFGVRLAHSLPVDKLKRVFAFLLLAVATKMLWSLF